MKKKNRKYSLREEMSWLKGKDPQYKVHNVTKGKECPHCEESRSSHLTWLRRGFYQCESCKEYFVTKERLENSNAKD